MVGWQEGRPAHKKPVPLIPRDSFLERLKEDPRENRLTEVYVEEQPLNKSSSTVVVELSCGYSISRWRLVVQNANCLFVLRQKRLSRI